jgi:hypothetical protein
LRAGVGEETEPGDIIDGRLGAIFLLLKGALKAVLGLELTTVCGFWLELDTIVTPERDSYEHIDDVLRAFIELAATHKCTVDFCF